jgi:hypothetical protein
MTDFAVIGECMTDTANCEILKIHKVHRRRGQIFEKVDREGFFKVFQ